MTNRAAKIVLIFFAGLLAGCKPEMDDATKRMLELESYRKDCSFYGYKQGTDGFRQCVESKDQREDAFRKERDMELYYRNPTKVVVVHKR